MEIAPNEETIVSIHTCHRDAEDAVRRMIESGLPMENISIICRSVETREDVQGFYRPQEAALEGIAQGAWCGAILGIPISIGLLLIPSVRQTLPVWLLVGACVLAGAALGALLRGMTAVRPDHQAIKFEPHTYTGGFLVAVHETAKADPEPPNSWPPPIEYNPPIRG